MVAPDTAPGAVVSQQLVRDALRKEARASGPRVLARPVVQLLAKAALEAERQVDGELQGLQAARAQSPRQDAPGSPRAEAGLGSPRTPEPPPPVDNVHTAEAVLASPRTPEPPPPVDNVHTAEAGLASPRGCGARKAESTLGDEATLDTQCADTLGVAELGPRVPASPEAEALPVAPLSPLALSDPASPELAPELGLAALLDSTLKAVRATDGHEEVGCVPVALTAEERAREAELQKLGLDLYVTKLVKAHLRGFYDKQGEQKSQSIRAQRQAQAKAAQRGASVDEAHRNEVKDKDAKIVELGRKLQKARAAVAKSNAEKARVHEQVVTAVSAAHSAQEDAVQAWAELAKLRRQLAARAEQREHRRKGLGQSASGLLMSQSTPQFETPAHAVTLPRI